MLIILLLLQAETLSESSIISFCLDGFLLRHAFQTFLHIIKTPSTVDGITYLWYTIVISMDLPEPLSLPFVWALEIWSGPKSLRFSTNLQATSTETSLQESATSGLTSFHFSSLQLPDPSTFYVKILAPNLFEEIYSCVNF